MAQQNEMKLVSPAMHPNSRMPRKHTGDGTVKDISPPLEWYNVPSSASSLVLLVEDIDEPENPSGPAVPWTHWVVVNLPVDLKGLPEGFSGKGAELGDEYMGVKEGYNDWKVPGWRGPISPAAPGHQIRFKVFALDQERLELGNKVTKEKVLEAIEGRVVGEAEFVVFV